MNLPALKTYQADALSESVLIEQIVSAEQHQTKKEDDDVNATLLFDEKLFCGVTSINMEQDEIGAVPNGNENDENYPNHQFWLSIEAHYLENPEDELVTVLVEDGNLNPRLHLSGRTLLHIAARSQANAIQLLTTPDPPIDSTCARHPQIHSKCKISEPPTYS